MLPARSPKPPKPLKFRTQREAAEFVRKVHNENGGPNAKIVAMRTRYNDVNLAKAERDTTSQFDENST